MTKSVKSVVILLLASLCGGPVFAVEVDNFTTRSLVEIDSTPIINRLFNDELDALVSQWTGPPEAVPFTLAFIRAIDKTPVLNRITHRFVEAGGRIQYVRSPIYSDSSCFTTATVWVRPLAGVIFLNGIPVGVDKIGHFHDGGSAIYRRVYDQGQSLEQALDWSVRTENGLLGYWVDGIFSNADVVANYEGFRFYRSLFQPDRVSGLTPVLSVVDGKIVKNREIDLADHVTGFWNEAMNPSKTMACMERHLLKVLPKRCQQFRAHPNWYVPQDEEKLLQRYSVLALRPNPEFRMDHICTADEASAGR